MSARRTPSRSDERGFVLVLVLFVVAALTMTVSGALLITQSDHATARASVDANRVFHIAQAGLMNMAADRAALRSDSVVYEIAGGRVVVRARRVAATGLEEIYEISSRATLFARGTRSEMREVRQLAALDLRPFNPTGALGTTARNVTLAGTYSGNDQSSSGQCAAAARGNRTGFAGVYGGTTNLNAANTHGQPRTEFMADTAAMRARINARWNELMDTATTFDYEYRYPTGTWPSFSSLSPGDYPTIRVRGDFFADSTRSGRGMLIVEGAIAFGPNFVWDGVIMSGNVPNSSMATNAIVRGSVMLGLAATSGWSLAIGADPGRGPPQFYYDACKVMFAARGIARFRLLPNTWSEPLS